MATKRTASEAGATSSGPPAKKNVSTFEPTNIGTVSTLEEMDIKVLQFQNKKLCERIELRRKNEEELKRRIEQLEQRQATDDAVLVIVNRYWNQLDEDVRVLLQRFDAENADESEKKNESAALTSFLTLLSQWDKPEIEEKLQQRVQFSNRAIGKLLTAYDRILQRNIKMRQALKDHNDKEEEEDDESVIKALDSSDTSIYSESQLDSGDFIILDHTFDEEKDIKSEETEVKTEPKQEVKEEESPVEAPSEQEVKPEVKQEPSAEEIKTEDQPETNAEVTAEVKKEVKCPKKEVKVSEVIMEEFESLQSENKRLHDLITELHHKHHQLTLENSELMDKLTAAETETAELHNKVEDLEYNLDISRTRLDKYDRHLADAMAKVRTYEEGTVTIQGGGEGVSRKKFDEIYTELEEQRELATNRMVELEHLQKDHQEALKEVEGLKMDLATLPKHVIQETTDYKVLASQYSVLYNESMQMKTQLDEARKQLQILKQEHIRHIEQMEADEIEGQKKMRVEMIQLEDQVAQVSREYQMLRIEFEQTLAANEQTAPINHEMRNLITSLKNHREQLKGEIARYKRKLKEAQTEIAKLKAEQQAMEGQGEKKEESASSGGTSTETPETPATPSSSSGPSLPEKPVSGHNKPRDEVIIIKKDEEEEKEEKGKDHGKNDADIIKDLKMQLKKSQDNQKELKLLLDMYKSVPKEARDKVQLMAGEKKAKQDVEELKALIRKMQEAERKERRKLAEEDAIRKIKKLEETIAELQKNLSAQKQEEEALLSEMEVTGQAFEDMQEQNIRLLQQLKEKDDANFKLMSERIKSNQIHKLLREEKEILAENVLTIQRQVEAQNQVVRKLEEKERILQNNMNAIEKELGLRQQAAEMHKRKAVESAQTAADLKLHLDKYHSQLKDAQVTVGDKTSALQQETFKHKRLLEEIASLRRKVERAKKIEMATSADEVLMEEIREYKEQLTCPSCKVKKKDAVLTKCFHVFCLECLKTRYETRQRKCPKCNATFGANDFHRLYLT